jgi:hypothetical protein
VHAADSTIASRRRARRIVARLTATAASVDGTGRQIVRGGQDLERVAASLDLHAVEPLAGAAEGVGRITKKLTRRGGDG